MDQGVLESIKRRYKIELLEELVLKDEEGIPILTFLKSINMLLVVTLISASWNEITARTLQKSWRKILPEGPEDQPTQGQEPVCVSTASAGTQQPSCEPTGVEDFHSMFHTLGHDLSKEEICAWLASDQQVKLKE